MATELKDVVDAINSLGATMSGRAAASAPDSPEMVQRRVEALDAENAALERQHRLIEQRAASSQRDAALRENEIAQARLTEERLQALVRLL